jgi:hypothetical protein
MSKTTEFIPQKKRKTPLLKIWSYNMDVCISIEPIDENRTLLIP